MAITFFAEGVKLPAIKKRETGDWIKNVAGIYGKKCGDISYIFCSDEKILEINREYLDHDYYTDIIFFGVIESNDVCVIIVIENISITIITQTSLLSITPKKIVSAGIYLSASIR